MINEIKEAMESQQFLVLGDDSRKFIRYLLDELEKAQKEEMRLKENIKILAEDHADIVTERDEVLEENRRLSSEHTAMKEALEWYADDANYHDAESAKYSAAVLDEGATAQAVLSTLKKEESHE